MTCEMTNSSFNNCLLSPGEPDVLLAKLDGKGRRIDHSLGTLNCNHIIRPGEEVVVRRDGVGNGDEEDQSGSEHSDSTAATHRWFALEPCSRRHSSGDCAHFSYELSCST